MSNAVALFCAISSFRSHCFTKEKKKMMRIAEHDGQREGNRVGKDG